MDYNGVLDTYSGWKGPDHEDPPRSGVELFLASLKAMGYEVVILTSQKPARVRRWLRKHGLKDHVDRVVNYKVPAHVYIDDRAICFGGNFADTLDQIARFKAHWEGP